MTKSVYMVEGDDASKCQDFLKAYMHAFEQKHTELNISVFDLSQKSLEWSEVIAAILMPPFGSDKRMVVLQHMGDHQGLRDVKVFEETLIATLKTMLESTFVLIDVSGALDKRKTITKQLYALSEVRRFDVLDQALGLLQQCRGTIISMADMPYVEAKIRSSAAGALEEMRKLILFANGKNVTRKDLEVLLTGEPTEDVFQFLQALFSGSKKEALSKLQRLAQTEEPLKLMGLMVWNAEQLLYALDVVESKLTENEVIALTGVKPFVFQKSLKTVRGMGRARLVSFITELMNVDRQIKTGRLSYEGAEIFEGLERVCLTL